MARWHIFWGKLSIRLSTRASWRRIKKSGDIVDAGTPILHETGWDRRRAMDYKKGLDDKQLRISKRCNSYSGQARNSPTLLCRCRWLRWNSVGWRWRMVADNIWESIRAKHKGTMCIRKRWTITWRAHWTGTEEATQWAALLCCQDTKCRSETWICLSNHWVKLKRTLGRCQDTLTP